VRLYHYKKNKRYYAIKCINKSWVIDNSEAASVRSELGVLSSLSHRFIANFFTAFENHSFVFIVQEYCVGGPLSNFSKTAFSPQVAKFYMAEVASALTYLHKSMSVVHRDLNVSE
jgi:serine/threonine protein kinase